MNVKDLFSAQKDTPQLFWSLVLEEGYAQAGIWHIKDEQAVLIATSIPCPWEVDSELLGAVDAALSACIQKLPEGYKEPEKTVFGVPSLWTQNGDIKSEYTEKIKKICEELSLTPTGFVVISEAIAHYFKATEGTPLSAVVLGVGHENLELSIFKTGDLVGTTDISRSISVLDDLIEGLARFESASPLPSRIIIYDGKGQELTEVSDILSGADWSQTEKINFLHTPKVEILESDKKVLATSLAGANEMASVEKIVVEEVPYDEDIKNIEVPSVPVSASDMGFMVDSDNVLPKEENAFIPVTKPQVSQQVDFLPKRNIFHDLKSKINLKVPQFKFSFGNKLTTLIIGFTVFFGALFAAWWFLPKANITIYIAPKKLSQDLEMSFDEADIVSAIVSGEKTDLATGKKIIGDRAKGSVLIQNGTANGINLKAGTILYSSSNLKFVTDETASISAALSTTEPGKATIPVTSESIGAEYNLGKDEVFKVGNYPKADVDGRSTADFSGGSSREISAVSSTDQENLKEDLTAELAEKLKDEFLAKSSSDQIVIDDFVSLEDVSVSFNHKVGDEADNLKLVMDLEAKTISYDRKKLADFVREKIKEQIPQGFVLRDSQIEYNFKFKEEKDKQFIYSLTVTANFLPEIKNEELKKKISGKVIKIAEDYLATIPGFVRAEISLKPLLPGRLGIVPMVLKNINVEIAAER